jgi:hypothetical protein
MARRDESVAIEVDSGTSRAKAVRGKHVRWVLWHPENLLLPAMFLMKICMVDSGSADEQRDARDEIDEMLLERIMTMAVMTSG